MLTHICTLHIFGSFHANYLGGGGGGEAERFGKKPPEASPPHVHWIEPWCYTLYIYSNQIAHSCRYLYRKTGSILLGFLVMKLGYSTL